MIRLLIISTFVLLAKAVTAQDLIVTVKNDSIRCKITNDDFSYIYYTLSDKSVDKIKTTEVKFIRLNYVDQKTVISTSILPKEPINASKNEFSLDLKIGPSYLSAKTLNSGNDIYDRYKNNLKLGYHFTLGMNYGIKENIGLGVQFKRFYSSNSINTFEFRDSSNVSTFGKLSDKISVDFYAIKFIGKKSIADKNIDIFTGVSIGYVKYNNDSYAIIPINISGNSVGYQYEFGIDYKISKKLGVELAVNLFQSTLKKQENLARMELSGGIRYYLQR